MPALFRRIPAALLPALICIGYCAVAPCPARAGQILIPDGTPVHFTLLKALKSGGDKAGEVVPFAVSKDVYGSEHALLLPADTLAFGKILQSNRRGMFGQSGKLKFTIDYILAPDKTHIPLRADAQLVRGRDNRGAAIATAVLLNVFGVFINGHDVTVSKGQDFIMYVDAAAPTVPAAPPAVMAPAPKANIPVLAAAPAAPSQSLITFANGTQTVGTLLGFDGSIYTVSTPKGMRQLKKEWITSIRALPPTPVAVVVPGY